MSVRNPGRVAPRLGRKGLELGDNCTRSGCSAADSAWWARGQRGRHQLRLTRTPLHACCNTFSPERPLPFKLAPCLRLGEVAQREQRARQLALAEVRQEVRLVFDGIRGQRQPHLLLSLLLLLLPCRSACRRRCCMPPCRLLLCCRRDRCPPLQPGIVTRGDPVKGPAVLRFQVLIKGAKLDPAEAAVPGQDEQMFKKTGTKM